MSKAKRYVDLVVPLQSQVQPWPDYKIKVKDGSWTLEIQLNGDRSAELERYILQLVDEQIAEERAAHAELS